MKLTRISHIFKPRSVFFATWSHIFEEPSLGASISSGTSLPLLLLPQHSLEAFSYAEELVKVNSSGLASLPFPMVLCLTEMYDGQ